MGINFESFYRGGNLPTGAWTIPDMGLFDLTHENWMGKIKLERTKISEGDRVSARFVLVNLQVPLEKVVEDYPNA